MKTKQDHILRHVELHQLLDELVADWITQTGSHPSKNTVLDLMYWSQKQTLEPDDKHGEYSNE